MFNKIFKRTYRKGLIPVYVNLNLRPKAIFRYLPIVFILVCLNSSCNSEKKKSISHLTIANVHFKNKDFSNALKETEFSIQLDSNNYDAIILKAKIKSTLEYYEDAIKILQSLLSKSYKVDTINFLLGEYFFSLGNYYSFEKIDDNLEIENLKKALKYYSDALSNNPHYYESYISKSHVLHNLGKYDEALITVNNALNLYQDSMALIYSRGVEKYSLGDNIEAIQDIDEALSSGKLDSVDMSSAFRFRGRINGELDNIDSAIQDVSKAILYNSKSELAYYLRGEMYEVKGMKNKACEDYRKSAELGLVSAYEKIKIYCNN